MVGLWLSYLHIWTYAILHQYLADLGVASQCCPVQNSVTVHVHQIHTRRPWTRLHFSHVHLNHSQRVCFQLNAPCSKCPPLTLDKREDDVPVSHLTSSEQRRVLHHVQGVDHCLLLQQELHCAHVARQGGGVQRCWNTQEYEQYKGYTHTTFSQNK